MKIVSRIFVLAIVAAAFTTVGCRSGFNGTCGHCGALNYPSQYNYGAPAPTYAPQGTVIQQPGYQPVQPGFQQVQPGMTGQ